MRASRHPGAVQSYQLGKSDVGGREAVRVCGSKMNGEALLKTTSGTANSEARKNNRRCIGPLLYHLLVHLVTIE